MFLPLIFLFFFATYSNSFVSLIHSVKPIFEFPSRLPPHPSQRLANGVLYNDSWSIAVIFYFAPNNLWGEDRGNFRAGGHFMEHFESRPENKSGELLAERTSFQHACYDERKTETEREKEKPSMSKKIITIPVVALSSLSPGCFFVL